MAPVFFFIAALGAIAGAVGVVALRHPLYNVLSLVFHLLSLAALFLLLRAEFVAAAQVVVYAGAVMVLYVFVVAYVGGAAEPLSDGVSESKTVRALSIGIPVLLLIELLIATLGAGLTTLGDEGAPYVAGFGSPQEVGRLFLTDFLLVFEISSVLLVMAAVGAVVLARRREDAGDARVQGAISVKELLSPEGLGSMAETVSGRSGIRKER